MVAPNEPVTARVKAFELMYKKGISMRDLMAPVSIVVPQASVTPSHVIQSDGQPMNTGSQRSTAKSKRGIMPEPLAYVLEQILR